MADGGAGARQERVQYADTGRHPNTHEAPESAAQDSATCCAALNGARRISRSAWARLAAS